MFVFLLHLLSVFPLPNHCFYCSYRNFSFPIFCRLFFVLFHLFLLISITSRILLLPFLFLFFIYLLISLLFFIHLCSSYRYFRFPILSSFFLFSFISFPLYLLHLASSFFPFFSYFSSISLVVFFFHSSFALIKTSASPFSITFLLLIPVPFDLLIYILSSIVRLPFFLLFLRYLFCVLLFHSHFCFSYLDFRSFIFITFFLLIHVPFVLF